MCGKIPQFSLSGEEDHEVRQKDALAKQKMKIYADKRANAKPSPIQEGDMVLLRQEKKNKLSTPFEGIPYTVSQKKGSMVLAIGKIPVFSFWISTYQVPTNARQFV